MRARDEGLGGDRHLRRGAALPALDTQVVALEENLELEGRGVLGCHLEAHICQPLDVDHDRVDDRLVVHLEPKTQLGRDVEAQGSAGRL